MDSSLKRLKKILDLETERGYDNGAVLGGVDKILDSWEAEARGNQVQDDLIQFVVNRLTDYPRLTPGSRQDLIEGIFRRLERQTPVPQPVPSESPPAPVPAFSPVAESDPNSEASPEGVSPDTPAPQPVSTSPSLPAEAPAPAADSTPAALNASVTVLPGVGERNAKTLSRLELYTLGDMLYHFPRRYDDYTQLKPINRLWFGDEVTLIGTIQNINSRRVRSGKMQIVEAVVSDGSGSLRVTWFNQPWLAKRLKPGQQVVLSGKIEQYLGRLTMNSPEWEPLERENLHTNRIVPVYPLTARLTQRWLRRTMHRVVTYWASRVGDPMPAALLESADLVRLSDALLNIHFPESWEKLAAARHRLAFDEIFLLQLGVLRQKHAWTNREGRRFEAPDDWIQERLAALPFTLTGAQKGALNDIRRDLTSGQPMNRLLQGDVGSGKTVVAALAVGMITLQNAQAALMAPTSILAEQHYHNLTSLLNGAEGVLQPHEIRLMLGATSEPEKQEIRKSLERGETKLVIGTHALIEDPVIFRDLQLAIIDEQHRFGVAQRSALRSKGSNPHLLVMTATPIPRSLALTVYGDLDLSVIDEMPPGRLSVDTFVLTPHERERAYSLIRSQIREGHQAFMIYPLVEESEKSEAKAAVEEHQRLQKEVFPDLKLALLHGRMKPDEKEATMSGFRDGDFDILVSTSVVEVGVDVPNATIMLIEGANRFGLAQLHQFRGRVGRGVHQSYCLLIPDTVDDAENERLAAMVETNDGFILADRDLEHRGPGEFLGTRQSGFSELRLATLTDLPLIEKARRWARNLFEGDPFFEKPEHQLLHEAVDRFWGNGKGDIS